ncbi:MAG TPA: nuclear transport factor 2 family protein [Vicinamibacteria bacterium]|nr:nuclear transport factor 2 family protein [Vicinamibacteria bacterium]
MGTLAEVKTSAVSDKRAAMFLDALGRRDYDALSSLLAPNVWFRALLPRKLYDLDNRQEAIATFRSWFGGAADFQVLETDHHTLVSREYIRYRFLLRPDWGPEQWHVIEQVGFFRVKEGSISRLDLVCTGFFPLEELEALDCLRERRPHLELKRA